MEPGKIRQIAIILGVDPIKLSAALDELDKEEEQPSEGIEGFYYNPDVFRRLHNIDNKGLRDLVTPNLKKLRR